MVFMTYVQFAKQHGLVTDCEVQGHIHGGLMAAHMPNSYHRRYKNKLEELQSLRAEGMRKYREAIASGEVEPWPEQSSDDRIKANASGDPDMPSTQAAQRVLARRQARQQMVEQ